MPNIKRLSSLIALILFTGFLIFVIVQVNSGTEMPWLGRLGGMPLS